MQQSHKTVFVFLFGTLVMVAMLFFVVWRLISENSLLKTRMAVVNQQEQLNYAYIENEIEEPHADLGLLRFKADVMERKYPHFSRVVKAVYEKSREHRIDANLLMSIIETESAFNPYAVSSAGAYGLMQINFSIWKEELNIDHQKIFDIDYNLDLGIKIYQHYLKLADNDQEKALHYYNNGFKLTNNEYVDKVASTVFY